MLLPVKQAFDRAEIEKNESDSAYFHALMYAGEIALKLTVSGLVAAVQDDRDRNRYRLRYQIVRGESLGIWIKVLDDILTGQSSQFLDAAARETTKALTEKTADGTWQAISVNGLQECLRRVDLGLSQRSTRKVQGQMWFKHFVYLRNGTRGHGAPSATILGRACTPLAESIKTMVTNLPLYALPWAYLHRNLSGKYRVTLWGGTSELLDNLKQVTTYSYENGVYIELNRDTLSQVALVDSNPEGTDFWISNGGFSDTKYEMISYLTNDRVFKSSKEYLYPVEELPASETDGLDELDVKGNTHTNIPEPTVNYVSRPGIEKELEDQLVDSERRRIVTLTGSGGIGKTSTALQVISKLINSDKCPYEVVVWFSSRDVDLLATGPKLVRPRGLSIDDFSKEYVNLLRPKEMKDRAFEHRNYLSKHLRGTTDGIGPILFVFDNFETATSPFEVFKWIDTFVRRPNLVLITSRYREFTGDYEVKVPGMTQSEAEELVIQTANVVGVSDVIKKKYREELVSESNGHPYVIKLMIGEIALGTTVKERLNGLWQRKMTFCSPFLKGRTIDSHLQHRGFTLPCANGGLVYRK